MVEIAIAAGIMAGLGLVLAVVLTVAWKMLRVEEDPRVEQVEELLPATNCGACGEAGCHAFAEKLAAGERSPSGCSVSTQDAIDEIAAMLGVAAGDAVKMVARVHCAGGEAQAYRIAEYEGLETCGAAALIGGGGKACSWGCLGLADCAVACHFDAITMSPNGLPVVDPAKCTACGDCVVACPRDLFHIEPINVDVLVQCSAPLAGDDAHAVCSVSCDACGRCAQDAPDGLIVMKNNLPVVSLDHGALGSKPTLRCPTGAIIHMENGQQLPQELAALRRRNNG